VYDNGLTVLSEHVPGVRSVAFGAWVKAASIHEAPHEQGVSHVLEHLVFKGTPTRTPRDLTFALETLGGSLDAYTSRDHTAYIARVLDEHLDIAADVIADLVFRPLLRAADWELERGVILEEIAEMEDTPEDVVHELHNAALWGGHPYGWSILGTPDTVGALPVDAVRALHHRAYHPGLMVVAAAGNVTHDALVASLERAGWLSEPARDAAPMPAPVAPVPPPPQRVHVDRPGQQVQVVFGGPSVHYAHPERYAVALVSMLLGDGMSSRLFQKVREELALAYSIATFTEFYHAAGMQGVALSASPAKAAKAEAVVRDELDRLAQHGIPDDELEAGKRQLKGQLTLSMEGPSSRLHRAAAVDLYAAAYQPLDRVLAEIDAITPARALAACQTYFSAEHQTVLSLGPRGSFPR
jgi:predicted Zn-dependent peptidase